jgi:hypothetical protein
MGVESGKLIWLDDKYIIGGCFVVLVLALIYCLSSGTSISKVEPSRWIVNGMAEVRSGPFPAPMVVSTNVTNYFSNCTIQEDGIELCEMMDGG